MDKILDFIVYAFRCVILLFLSLFGQGEVSDHWLKDTIVGIVTLVIIILLLYAVFRLTGLIHVKK